MTSRIVLILSFISLAVALEAQPQAAIDGPVAGYVFDKGGSGLRPVLGLPGASMLGSPLKWRYRVDRAFIAPKLDSAVGVTSEGGFRVFRIRDRVVTESAVGALSPADPPYIVVYSP